MDDYDDYNFLFWLYPQNNLLARSGGRGSRASTKGEALIVMGTPPSFADLSDEEAYEQARERLVCDYCGYKYSSHQSLNEPIEVYSSQRKVKRWVCICRTCARKIESYERKMIRKKKKMETENCLYYYDDEDILEYEEGEKEGSSSTTRTRQLEDHEF
jgi:hypothetical protein